MAPNTARKLATIDDLLALPEDARAELIDGVIVPMEAARSEHNRAQRVLASRIGGPFDDEHGRGGPGGWWIQTEQTVKISTHRAVRPDVAGWRRERLPDPWGQVVIIVAPDWVCEVLSPTNERHDRLVKADYYATIGVPFYWLVSPAERLLETYTLREGFWMRTGVYDDSAIARIPPFDAIEFPVGLMFPPAVPDEGNVGHSDDE